MKYSILSLLVFSAVTLIQVPAILFNRIDISIYLNGLKNPCVIFICEGSVILNIMVFVCALVLIFCISAKNYDCIIWFFLIFIFLFPTIFLLFSLNINPKVYFILLTCITPFNIAFISFLYYFLYMKVGGYERLDILMKAIVLFLDLFYKYSKENKYENVPLLLIQIFFIRSIVKSLGQFILDNYDNNILIILILLSLISIIAKLIMASLKYQLLPKFSVKYIVFIKGVFSYKKILLVFLMTSLHYFF